VLTNQRFLECVSQKVGQMKFAIIAIAIVLGVIRPFLSPHPVSLQGSYEAIAHLFVGGVIGAWLVTRARWLLVIGIGLTVVEVASAVAGSFMH
jgi:hypothetical protein